MQKRRKKRGRWAAACFVLMLLAAGWGGAGAAYAQEGAPPDTAAAPADTTQPRRVDILHADSLAGSVEDGAPVRQLTGAVRLRQGPTRLSADRATQYTGRDEILFVGNVLIIDEGDSLSARRVLYDSRTKVGHATGDVRLADGEVVVRAPSGRYFSREDRAEFEEGVTLVDSASVLQSRQGEYFTEEKRAEFYGDVRLRNDRTYLEADSVTYFRDTEVSIARGNVFVERFGGEEEEDAAAATADADTTTRTLLFGNRVYNDNPARYSRVDGNALLIQLRRDSTGAPSDTLLMRAAHLETVREDSLERLIAIDSVRAWQKDLAAVADSAVYVQVEPEGRPEREETRLYQDPIAWTRQAQISGDTIRVTGRARSADSLFVYAGAFVAQLDTTLERVHQLKGQRVVGHFEEDTLRHMLVGPNAQAIRFLADSEGQPSGAVQVSSDYMHFWTRGGELHRMRSEEGIEGMQYPEDQVPEPFQLEGYRWVPEWRPTKEALLADERVRQRLSEEPPDRLALDRPPTPPAAAATAPPNNRPPAPQDRE